MEMAEEVVVLVIGAEPAGLVTAACLARRHVPYVMVERESCSASLWRHRTYDRLKLHLAKEFCELPHMAYPMGTPTYVPRKRFVEYLDGYIDRFRIRPRYRTVVESAVYDDGRSRWVVSARDMAIDVEVKFVARFLVIATGENSKANIPLVPGLPGFVGEAILSSVYKSGKCYTRKNILVVGAGNSGMEVAYDLATHGANTSIVVRRPLNGNLNAANVIFGDMSKHGIVRPKMGPLLLKSQTGRSAIIDVGTAKLIRGGFIKVFTGISTINANSVVFHGGKEVPFDAILFATGYKSTNGESMFKDGFPKKGFPNHWKGEDGLYCVGFARRGLTGIAMDAKNVIEVLLK
uniref:indole-3-pyruvate monooxygenase n=1 Tax=Oryza brachyantha TaxID=4533 RepID=B9V0J0_ORYBR|nr:flavin monoxygenase family-2 [Oryza brachyantha]